jgi:ribonuclease HI
VKALLHTDGGTRRTNPGKAAYGFVILDRHEGSTVEEGHGFLGIAGNNIAEYIALIRGLERALELGVTDIVVKSDSQLIVNQVNGNWSVKKDHLRGFHREATRLADMFDRFKIGWIPRKDNKRADALARIALKERFG